MWRGGRAAGEVRVGAAKGGGECFGAGGCGCECAAAGGDGRRARVGSVGDDHGSGGRSGSRCRGGDSEVDRVGLADDGRVGKLGGDGGGRVGRVDLVGHLGRGRCEVGVSTIGNDQRLLAGVDRGDLALAVLDGAEQPEPPVTATVPVGVAALPELGVTCQATVYGWPTTVGVARVPAGSAVTDVPTWVAPAVASTSSFCMFRERR